MANTIDWGKATQNNTNGFGKYQNTINAGVIYADSYSGETTLVGTSAAFSYSKSSFHQGEADPTPTITGTTGGTFSATPSGLSINTSTGTIDLDNSTIQSYIITYTVSGVSANFSLSVTASPFIANDFSMNFDSASSQYIEIGDTTNLDDGNLSISLWFNASSVSGTAVLIDNHFSSTANAGFTMAINTSSRIYVDRNTTTTDAKTNFVNMGYTLNTWHHLLMTYNDTTKELKVYLDNVLKKTITGSASSNSASLGARIGRYALSGTSYFNGKIDEVAIWNAALSSDAVTEIYNATYNNTGKVLDLNTDTGNYTSSANLQYWNRLGD